MKLKLFQFGEVYVQKVQLAMQLSISFVHTASTGTLAASRLAC